MTEDNFVIEENVDQDLSQHSPFIIIPNSDDENDDENQNNINDSLVLYENQKSNKKKKYLGSEEAFINQKLEVEKMKKRNELFSLKKERRSINNINTKYIIDKSDELNNINGNELNDEQNISKEKLHIFISEKTRKKDNDKDDKNIDDEIQTFSLNDYQYFEYSIINNKYKEHSFDLDIDNEWTPLNKKFPFSYVNDENKGNSYDFIEMKHLALRIIQEIDYEERGLLLNINFNLIDNSELWIFTRSFVNKSINDSFYFDEKSENVDKNDIFNKYSSLIKIFKDTNLNRCFISFGTFYHDKNQNNKLYYKSFLKRQLIDYSYGLNGYDSKSEFNLFINDLGEEKINAKIFYNNGTNNNDISGNFFLPLNKKAKILICGKGHSVQLNEFVFKSYNKKKDIGNSIQFEKENNEPKNCECCSIL